MYTILVYGHIQSVDVTGYEITAVKTIVMTSSNARKRLFQASF